MVRESGPISTELRLLRALRAQARADLARRKIGTAVRLIDSGGPRSVSRAIWLGVNDPLGSWDSVDPLATRLLDIHSKLIEASKRLDSMGAELPPAFDEATIAESGEVPYRRRGRKPSGFSFVYDIPIALDLASVGDRVWKSPRDVPKLFDAVVDRMHDLGWRGQRHQIKTALDQIAAEMDAVQFVVREEVEWFAREWPKLSNPKGRAHLSFKEPHRIEELAVKRALQHAGINGVRLPVSDAIHSAAVSVLIRRELREAGLLPQLRFPKIEY
jgi:hypothetical protein